MRASGVRGLVVTCADSKCSHSEIISGDEWPGHLRLSDLEHALVCRVCGHRGVAVRPNYQEAPLPDKGLDQAHEAVWLLSRNRPETESD